MASLSNQLTRLLHSRQHPLHSVSKGKFNNKNNSRMQAAALCIAPPSQFKGTTKSLVPRSLTRPQRTVNFPMVFAAAAPETSTVDYSSTISVFPAEACDTVGGEACDVQMFPEVKPPAPATSTKASISTEEGEREYLEYDEPKTVFPAEACDDLGGEFCEPEYQKGVFE